MNKLLENFVGVTIHFRKIAVTIVVTHFVGHNIQGNYLEKATKIWKQSPTLFDIKVWTFWEAHKNLRNLPHSSYLQVNVQTTRKIFSNFVAFSQHLNFRDGFMRSITFSIFEIYADLLMFNLEWNYQNWPNLNKIPKLCTILRKMLKKWLVMEMCPGVRKILTFNKNFYVTMIS